MIKQGRSTYSRRLANHNCMITELKNVAMYCYFYSESECNKGSSEIATVLRNNIGQRNGEGIKY